MNVPYKKTCILFNATETFVCDSNSHLAGFLSIVFFIKLAGKNMDGNKQKYTPIISQLSFCINKPRLSKSLGVVTANPR